MKQLSQVVWNEGMHLAQHHFQAQSRFYEDTVQFALSALFFRPYGLVACELDRDALKNDTVALVHARGVMPDGLAFDIPSSDPAPQPLYIRDLFSPTADNHLVLLAIPAYRADRSNVSTNGTQNGGEPTVRYTAHQAAVRDALSGRDERNVTLGRKNFRLLLDAEATQAELEGMVVLPIARARRDGTGHFAYDPDYVAPSLQIGASPRLMNLLHRLTEILESRADAITRGRRGSSDEFAQQEVANFWLLHTIHASLPALRHQLQAKHVHPERLYVELARLAGALCTFTLDVHPRMLPLYDHDAPQTCFDALDRHIRQNLEIVAPSGRSAIAFTSSAPYLHTAQIQDAGAFNAAQWVLGVRSSMQGHETSVRFPELAKVCSSKFVLELVRRAYPGLTLTHLPYPPASIQPRGDTQYFAIERAGPCWDTIVSSREVGVYVPDAISNVSLDLSIVYETAR
jgi:type VI secretion system protein ImpJ